MAFQPPLRRFLLPKDLTCARLLPGYRCGRFRSCRRRGPPRPPGVDDNVKVGNVPEVVVVSIEMNESYGSATVKQGLESLQTWFVGRTRGSRPAIHGR